MSGSNMTILHDRMSGIGERLDGPWAKALREQRHLDRDTNECAYWHSGYHQALADVLALLSDRKAIDDISGKPTPCQAAC